VPIEFIVSIGSVNAIAAAHPAVVATAKQVGLEQVRDEAGEAAVRGVDNRQTSRRRQALNAQPRLTPASPEYLKYLADQQAMQQAVDRQMGGVGRSR
jgi:hypothetical protein